MSTTFNTKVRGHSTTLGAEMLVQNLLPENGKLGKKRGEGRWACFLQFSQQFRDLCSP